MHQGHNIPWSTFEKCFTFVVDDRRFTPPFTGLVYKESPAGAVKELQHFVRKFVATIKEFSETEREKYSSKAPSISTTDKLFSDALRDKYPEYLKARFQSLSSWIDCSKGHSYGGLREAVMALLFENEMDTLFALAQHPQVPMAQILQSDCGHYQSMRGEESALWVYLFFNAMEAVGQLYSGGYARTKGYRHLIDTILVGSGWCGQQVVHEILFSHSDMHNVGFTVHMPIEKLQEYIKSLFAMIYRYDALAREVGVGPQWERQIKDNIILQGGLPRQPLLMETTD